MLASCSLLSCNFSQSPLKSHSSFASLRPSKSSILFLFNPIHSRVFPKSIILQKRKCQLLFCKSSLDKDPLLVASSEEDEDEYEDETPKVLGERDWTTSFLLFVFWAGLMYYVFVLAPNQQPVTDVYLLKKLLNLKGDDGFIVNQVLVSLWYIMGLWPLLYSMLLIPSARSTESKIPMWPFIILSFAGGAYALIPYFVLWKPPAPPIQESELTRWPLIFLESKITASVTLGAGIAALVYGLSSGGDSWIEFGQYFQGSKFIHVMSIDFILFSTFAPFWVYNDMSCRKWKNEYSASKWILPLLSIIPLLGPALYLLIRPSLSKSQTSSN